MGPTMDDSSRSPSVFVKLAPALRFLRLVGEPREELSFSVRLRVTIFGVVAFLVLLNTRLFASPVEFAPAMDNYVGLWGSAPGSLLAFGLAP